ncbi:MAG: hypothetical protein ABIG32_02605 [Candidatus Uhrbacteria bacterium]|nr:hypothetical protein [Patescibacteria group bacterium]MBU1907025.1 hypothetical protein [Patescibacteria group bacterium]
MQIIFLRPVAWAAVVSWEFLTVLMLLHQWILGSSELGKFGDQWLQLLYPGYQTLNAIGILIALIQGFFWPLIFAWIFVTVYNKK